MIIFIALNDMNIHIYKTTGCSYCTKIIELMERAGVPYHSSLVGVDITREGVELMLRRAKSEPKTHGLKLFKQFSLLKKQFFFKFEFAWRDLN